MDSEGEMWLLVICLGVLASLGAYCWVGIGKAYRQARMLPCHVSTAIWVLDTTHAFFVVVSSASGVWSLPLPFITSLALGLVMFAVGLAVMMAGMASFGSLRKMSALETSGLVTTGIYKWSRNPQYVGWFVCLLGVSIAGRSGFALLLVAALILAIHIYNIRLEEPYLELLYGSAYREYRKRTPRYLGRPGGEE